MSSQVGWEPDVVIGVGDNSAEVGLPATWSGHGVVEGLWLSSPLVFFAF